MADTVTILNASDLAALGNIEVTDVSIYQKINDKYTLDFTAYEQPFIDLLATGVYINIFIKKENGQDVTDIFTLNEIRHNPVEGRYDVSCEHISYDLNRFTRNDETGIEEFTYSGTTGQIVTEILGLGSRFSFIPSDNIPGTFEFKTKTIGRRSRIIEFCKQEGFEVFWRNFNVAIQLRRGIDDGLSIELGSNLRGLEINTTFNFDQTTTTTFNVDFLDLNAILDENGQPLAPGSFDMGDYVTVRYNDDLYYQRVIAVKYNPFVRALPTVELENPVHDILEVIADTNNRSSQDNGGGGGEVTAGLNIIEFENGEYENLTYNFAVSFSDLFSNLQRNQYETIPDISGAIFNAAFSNYGVINITEVFLEDYSISNLTNNDVLLRVFAYHASEGFQRTIGSSSYIYPDVVRIGDDSDPNNILYYVEFRNLIISFPIDLNDDEIDFSTFGIGIEYLNNSDASERVPSSYTFKGHMISSLYLTRGNQ